MLFEIRKENFFLISHQTNLYNIDFIAELIFEANVFLKIRFKSESNLLNSFSLFYPTCLFLLYKSNGNTRHHRPSHLDLYKLSENLRFSNI
jgi:hypothetical protein